MRNVNSNQRVQNEKAQQHKTLHKKVQNQEKPITRTKQT